MANDLQKGKTNVQVEAAQPSQKYVRTLESDMRAVQKGGTPDLTPLPNTVPSTPVPAPAAPEIVEVETPLILAKTVATEPPPLSTPSAPVSMPELELPVVTRADAPPVLSETPPAQPLRTYASDFSDHLKDRNASTATVLAAQQDAGQGGEIETDEPAGRSWVSIVAGITLLLIGSGGLYYAYARYSTAQAPVVITPTVFAPIFVNDQEELMGKGPALLQGMVASVARPLPIGAVRILYSVSATTTRESIFVASRLPAPNILTRNIQGEKSMAGIVNVGGAQSPFFILSVSSYNDTFAGMLSWEPKMLVDFSILFPPYPSLVVAASTTPILVASSTPKKSKIATTTPPAPVFATPGFYDDVIANHDVRVYRDAFGQSIFLYGYWDQHTLVIARDAHAFIELLSRIANSHIQS